MSKMLKTLASELARMKLEGKQMKKKLAQDGGNRNPNQYRRPNNAPQVFQRERRNNECCGKSHPVNRLSSP
jgi:hypothetical protein